MHTYRYLQPVIGLHNANTDKQTSTLETTAHAVCKVVTACKDIHTAPSSCYPVRRDRKPFPVASRCKGSQVSTLCCLPGHLTILIDCTHVINAGVDVAAHNVLPNGGDATGKGSGGVVYVETVIVRPDNSLCCLITNRWIRCCWTAAKAC